MAFLLIGVSFVLQRGSETMVITSGSGRAEALLSVVQPGIKSEDECLLNPYAWSDDDAYKHPDIINDYARRDGHDGIIRTWGDGSREVVVFEPFQVKSAIGNCGSFSITDPDLRK